MVLKYDQMDLGRVVTCHWPNDMETIVETQEICWKFSWTFYLCHCSTVVSAQWYISRSTFWLIKLKLLLKSKNMQRETSPNLRTNYVSIYLTRDLIFRTRGNLIMAFWVVCSAWSYWRTDDFLLGLNTGPLSLNAWNLIFARNLFIWFTMSIDNKQNTEEKTCLFAGEFRLRLKSFQTRTQLDCYLRQTKTKQNFPNKYWFQIL